MNVVYILWLRQLKRSARSRARIIGSFGQPLLFLLAFGFGFGSMFQRAGQGNYIQFLAPGVITMSVLSTAIFTGIEVIWDRQFGFLKETLVAPVPRILIMIGRTLGGATVAVLQGSVVFGICLAVGFRTPSLPLLPLAFTFMILTAVLFTAVGTALACVLPDFQGFQLVLNFLVMPIFFLSGALFPLTNVPPAIGIHRQPGPAFLQRRRSALRSHRSDAFRNPAGPGGSFRGQRGGVDCRRVYVLEDPNMRWRSGAAAAPAPWRRSFAPTN
jgi:ABC-2 type transport system permease protein